MAFRGVLTHRKTRRLAKALGIPPCFALGILESLWHVTAEQAKDGGIGRTMSDMDIADEMFYEGDPTELINALVESGWIDRVEGCRLCIHDWHEHADDTTDNWLARKGIPYANGARPRMKRLSDAEKARISAQHSFTDKAVRTESHTSALPVPEPVTRDQISSEAKASAPQPKPEKIPAADSEPNHAYDPVNRVLLQVAEVLEWSEPKPSDILTQLKPDAAVPTLIDDYGEDGAIELFLFANDTWAPKRPTWPAVCRQRNQLWDEITAHRVDTGRRRSNGGGLIEARDVMLEAMNEVNGRMYGNQIIRAGT